MRNSVIQFIAFLAIITSLPIAAYADGAKQAQFVTGLFAKICVESINQTSADFKKTTSEKLPIATDEVKKNFLRGEEGDAWVASNPIGQFIVTYSEPHKCRIFAREADTKIVEKNFVQILEGIKTPGVKVEKIKDFGKPSNLDNQLGYLVFAEGREVGWVFLLTTSELNNGAQVRIVVGPAKR